jgi:hypothetical protein
MSKKGMGGRIGRDVGLLLLFAVVLPARGQQAAFREQRQLDVSFLFHFNQDLVPTGPAAAQVAYTGLITTLRANAEIPFQLQISGTLLNNLHWFSGTRSGT